MWTEPIKRLSRVSKVNTGGIRNFPSAVIMPITLPVADSTVICLVQSCFSPLPELIHFVYPDCSFAELFSLFFLVFSLFLGSVSAPRIVLFPLPLQGVSWKGRVSWNGDKFLGRKRCCCCSQLLCRCRDHPLLLLLVLSLESKNPSQEVKELLKEWAVGDSGSEADCFYLRDRKRSLVPLLLTKAHKETSTLTVSLPGKLAGVFH